VGAQPTDSNINLGVIPFKFLKNIFSFQFEIFKIFTGS